MSGGQEREAQLQIDLAETSYDRRGSTRARAELPALERLRAAGVLRDVDVHFARTTASLVDERDPLVLLGLAMASHAPGAGHVCVELSAPDRVGPRERGEDEWAAERAWWPEREEWTAALAASPVVATPEAWASGEARALVLDGERLYLARYWAYERRLLRALSARARNVRDDVDEALLGEGLARLFPRGANAPDGPDLQRAAACAAVLRSLAVITGGPGTGKTTTVLRVLALLVEQAAARSTPSPRIRLAAPTGKAAARLSASLRDGLARFGIPSDVAGAIPTTATTIHRLLGAQARTPTRFRHDAANPLAADVVVVDEASMADLALAAKLVDAVPADARLILLGDPDQLVSVEAGAILGDVCGDASGGDASARRSRAFAARLVALCDEPALAERCAPEHERVPAIADCIVRLTASRRFRDDAGIGALVRAINEGDADRALAVLADDPSGEVSFLALDGSRADVAAIRRLTVPRYRPVARARGPKEALDALDAFRVLAAHREGPLGVAGLNDAIARALAGEGTIPRAAAGDAWYAGQPILVTANDPALDLYNGDVGIALRETDGSLRAWFRATEGDGVRGIAPARLPAHETTFAMTVHKAQGSEFDDVVLVLPSRASRVLTRELLYTAVSRARRTVTVIGNGEVVRGAIGRRIERGSGLGDGLWGTRD
jgi:exodeoxyribonuclease V alpha subunit